MELLELVVGVAVLCEQKAIFINAIFGLGHTSQAYLKAMVEQVLSRLEDIGEGEEAGEDGEGEEELVKHISSYDLDEQLDNNVTGQGISSKGKASTQDADKIRALEHHVQDLEDQLLHLTEERNQLVSEKDSLEKNSVRLAAEIDRLTHFASNSASAPQTPGRAQQAQAVHYEQLDQFNVSLHKEIDELKLQLDGKVMENANLKNDLKQYLSKLQANSEMMLKYEMENQKYVDEIDVYKEKLTHYNVLESTLEKYKQKLEGLNQLKQTNKELNAQVDHYLDKIAELDASNKALQQNQKLLETYRNKNIELEREKFELQSKTTILEENLTSANQQLASLQTVKTKYQSEIRTLTQQLQDQQQRAASNAALGVSSAWGEENEAGSGLGGTAQKVIELRARVKSLEQEVEMLRASSVPPSLDGQDKAGSDAHAVLLAMSKEELVVEVEGLRLMKTQREDSLLEAHRSVNLLEEEKKNLTQSLQEMQKLVDDLKNQQSEELAQQQQDQAAAASALATAAAVKEWQQKHQIATNTINMVENKLKDKESLINKLEQEKSKLEAYARRSLTAFKEKFMTALQCLKKEKKDLEEKLSVQQAKLQKLNTIYSKEERLISSALFEMGVKMMDQHIQSQLLDQGSNAAGSSALPVTFLGLQREAIKQSNGDFVLNRSPIHTVASPPPSGSAGLPMGSYALNTPSK